MSDSADQNDDHDAQQQQHSQDRPLLQDAAATPQTSPSSSIIDPLPPNIYSLPSTKLRELLQQRQKRQGIWEADVATAMATLQTQKNVGMRESLIDHEGFPRDDIDVMAVRQARNTVALKTNDLNQLGDELKILLEATFAAISREQGGGGDVQDGVGEETVESIEERNMKMFEERRRKKLAALEQKRSTMEVLGEDDDVKKTMKMILQERQDELNKLWSEAGVVPVCILRDIAPNSPAFLANFLDGDVVVAVGEDRGSAENLKPEDSIQPVLTLADFAGVIKRSEGKSLKVVVERQNKNHQSSSFSHPGGGKNNRRSDFVELQLVPKKWSGNGILGCGLDQIKS